MAEEKEEFVKHHIKIQVETPKKVITSIALPVDTLKEKLDYDELLEKGASGDLGFVEFPVSPEFLALDTSRVDGNNPIVIIPGRMLERSIITITKL